MNKNRYLVAILTLGFFLTGTTVVQAETGEAAKSVAEQVKENPPTELAGGSGTYGDGSR